MIGLTGPAQTGPGHCVRLAQSMEAIIKPSGRVFPWRISRMLCSMPAAPAVRPSARAEMRVAFLMALFIKR